MNKLRKLPRRVLILGLLLTAAGRAQHDGLKDFNDLTGRWHGVSQTPVPNERLGVSFAADDSRLVYERDGKAGRELVAVDLATGEKGGPAAPEVEWKGFRAADAGAILLETGDGWKRWAEGALEEVEAPQEEPAAEPAQRPRGRQGGSRVSPDGRHEVLLRDGGVVLRERESGEELELAKKDGNQIFRDNPVWAPDSSRFAIWRTRDVPEHELHLIESAPKDQLQPKHSTRPYVKPGDEVDTRAPWVFFTDGSETIEPDLSLIVNPFECRNLEWRKDSRRLTFEFIERGFGKHNIIEIDSDSGSQRVLVREESDTFVFVYGNSYRRDLNDGEEILWMSERDGWKHLYLLDGRDGSVKRQLTKGEWVVRGVEAVDEEKREVLLRISGSRPEQDPYFIHFAKVSLDSGELVTLTDSAGNHDGFERSPGGNYYVCRWSRVDHPPVTELRRWEDGSLVVELERADDSALKEADWPLPRSFVAKDRDGRFDIHGIIVWPPDFDPAKKYPVIEHIYAGPQDSFVPKSWRPWMAPKHEIAVHGFIVVQIDGKGTANRSRDFHHFCYKNLKDAGLPDRIAWLKAAAAEHPEMDLERVGIFGGSAGGQSALGAMLFHGDFYKAAVADCGCHDNRMDKIWWNEQWMDWPVGPEYEDNSNVTHAKNLKGALMLTVGELDSNVDPASTYQVIDALIAADKDFEFLPMVGQGHGSGENRYAQRRRVEFFKRHLGDPR